MKDFGKYIRLDSWEEAEELGLKEGFKGYTSDKRNREFSGRELSEDFFSEAAYKGCCGSDFFPFRGRSSWRYAYVLKSSLPKKEERVICTILFGVRGR